jgi:hypothetical protein
MIAGFALVLLLALGLARFPFSPDTPSAVLVSTIMNANARNYAAAEDSFLPDAPFLNYRPWFQWVCDGITKKSTVKNVSVLGEEIRGDGAKVSFAIEYNDGTSSQSEVALSKRSGEWKVSLMGLALRGRAPRDVPAQSLRYQHLRAVKVVELPNPE